MRELSKSIQRRMREPNFIRSYFVGNGIDIGGKPDPLSLYAEFFPFMRSVKIWDLEDGDAQFMAGVENDSVDFVHSSHCLEHLRDPMEGLKNWVRILKPGGFLVVTVPDEDLYEQGQFPSTFNHDHKSTFTIFKKKSWSPRSYNLLSMLSDLAPSASVEKIELLTSTYRFGLPRFDQTSTPLGESAIEFIIRKTTPYEQQSGLRERVAQQPTAELIVHYNQYKDDYQQMKLNNKKLPPFLNKEPL